MSHETPRDEIIRALDLEKVFDQPDDPLNQKPKNHSESARQILLHVLLLNHTVISDSTRERNRIIQEDENEPIQVFVRDHNHRPYNHPHVAKAFQRSTRDFQPRQKRTNHR